MQEIETTSQANCQFINLGKPAEVETSHPLGHCMETPWRIKEKQQRSHLQFFSWSIDSQLQPESTKILQVPMLADSNVTFFSFLVRAVWKHSGLDRFNRDV